MCSIQSSFIQPCSLTIILCSSDWCIRLWQPAMCRLAAWSGARVALEDIIVKPSHSLIEQSQHATEAKLAVNGDGFGFAWYDESGQLGLYREVLPAWTDGNLLSLASMIRSTVFVAHVRASTYGQVSRSNCHPFKSGRWCFAHNGQIADFGLCRRQLEASLSDARYAERTGNTDSELLFLLLLDNGLERDARNACAAVIEQVKSASRESVKPTRIAAVFSDGEALYALRYSTDAHSPSLYYRVQAHGDLVIASEPLDNDTANWSSIDESTLLVAQDSSLSSHQLYVGQ